MNCERMQPELEELFYGELDARRALELRAHLSGCEECRGFEAALAREMEVYSRYPEVEPSAAMWDAIRERIHTEESTPSPEYRSRWSFSLLAGWLLQPAVLRQAAGALALIVLSVSATIYFTSRRDGGNLRTGVQPSPVADPASTPAPDPVQVPAPDAAGTSALLAAGRPAPVRPAKAKQLTDDEMIRVQVGRAEREYAGAIRLLDRAIAERKQQLDAGVIAQYESSLALIDDSIAKSRRAMRQDPGDPAARQFLLAAYARKVELMQEIALR
ncbi:MAG: zf-HC2 domain-containing protein [Acidobacteria bacterium]|nr:zf-HC2 domain-containing protein [Acidobacteriota bacterium]MCW5971485.1 zf-HC2 domain-containing protein [Blastocatellales bacterium]